MRFLIVVDMQNDFIDGSLGTPEAQAIVPKVKEKIDRFTEQCKLLGCRGKIVFTRDTHYNNYLDTQEGKNLPVKHCIWNTHGWEIASELDAENNAHHYINKPSFGYDNWKEHFDYMCESEEIESIDIVGLCTDICVISNALILKAIFPEVPMYVDASCCAGVTPEKHKAALETMKSCQICVLE